MSSFSTTLRKILKENNIQQSELAKAIGKSSNAINSWVTETEDIKAKPKWLEQVEKLMKFLCDNVADFSPCELFGIDKNEYEKSVFEKAAAKATAESKKIIENEKAYLERKHKILVNEEIALKKKEIEREYRPQIAEYRKLLNQQLKEKEKKLKEKYHEEMTDFLTKNVVDGRFKENDNDNDFFAISYFRLIKDPEFVQLLKDINIDARYKVGTSWTLSYYTELNKEHSERFAKLYRIYFQVL